MFQFSIIKSLYLFVNSLNENEIVILETIFIIKKFLAYYNKKEKINKNSFKIIILILFILYYKVVL